MIDALLKTTILLVLVTLATHVLRRRSAALRHLLWSFAILGLVMIPVLKRVAPEWRVLPSASTIAAATQQPSSGEKVQLKIETPPGMPVVPPSATEPSFQSTPVQAASGSTWNLPSLWTMLAALWLAGALVLLARLVVGLVTVQRIAGRAKEVTDANWRNVSDRSIRALDVRLPVDIRSSTEVAMPFACGVMRPVIVLPADADSWTAQQKEAVMLHELAHISRGDLAMNIISHVVRAVYWLNPLVWLASYRLRVEGERAADDAVLRGGARPSEYADHLLSIVRTVGPTVPNVALAMARRSDFEGRLLAILEPGLSRARLTRVRAAGLAALFIATVTPLAAMTQNDASVPAKSEGGKAEVVLTSGEQTPETPQPTNREPLPQAKGTVAALGESLNDENPSVRLAAVNSLGAIQDPAAITALARALKEDTDARVREAAAWALGEIDDNRAVPHLVEALKKEQAVKVKEKIVNALREIDDPSAASAVIAVLKDPAPEVRRAAVSALSEFEDAGSLHALLNMTRDEDLEVRREVANHLGNLENGPALDALIFMARDTDDEVRANAIESLHNFEDSRIVAPLVAALKDKSPHVRRRAADGLGNAHDFLKSAPPALIEALTDANRDVRRAAANSLGNIGDEAAVPALKKLTSDNDVETRRHAVEALKEIGGEEAIQALMGLLRDPDPEVRKTAAEALGRKRGGD